MACLLLHRLLIGVFVGGMQASPDADDLRARYAQTTCLVVASLAFLAYIVCVRPFAVPCANFFEAMVIIATTACLSRNYWFLQEDRTLLGVRLGDVEAANAVYWIMLASVVCMCLRLVAVMLPVKILQKTLFQIERRCIGTAMARILIRA